MKKILIDADPGTDDALAIMMALCSPELDVLGITTVGGNARLADTTRNALRLLEHIGATATPVYRGSARPLHGYFHYGYRFHGPRGLSVRLPSPETEPNVVAAPELIARMASAHRGDLTLLSIGPLTNIARALTIEPGVASGLKEIIVMGGAVEVTGNITPYAEFNIYNDPSAADIVFGSGIPVTLVGLDVTMQTFLGRDGPWISGDGLVAGLSRRLLGNWFKARPEARRYHLHDPLAVVAALRPGLLSYRAARVAVDTSDSRTAGGTTASYGGGTVRVAVGVDVEGALATIVGLLAASASRYASA